jgi:hypothetical protein
VCLCFSVFKQAFLGNTVIQNVGVCLNKQQQVMVIVSFLFFCFLLFLSFFLGLSGKSSCDMGAGRKLWKQLWNADHSSLILLLKN